MERLLCDFVLFHFSQILYILKIAIKYIYIFLSLITMPLQFMKNIRNGSIDDNPIYSIYFVRIHVCLYYFELLYKIHT